MKNLAILRALLTYLASRYGSVTRRIVNRPAFLPFTVRSLMIEVVQDFDMTTHTPGVPATMRVVPSPSFPCAASEYALMFQ